MTEREWREGSDLRTSRVGLAVVLVTAAVLRLWTPGRGMPDALGTQESLILDPVIAMMRSGSLHPHGFEVPALYTYLQFFLACIRFIVGAWNGAWSSLAQIDASGLLVWGRVLTAAFGVATVLLVFQIGMRWGGRHALLAAGLMAVMPLHVAYSHYVLTDVPLTFFVTLTLLLSVMAHERNKLPMFAAAGAAAGLAMATKYSGGIALLMPLLACWMTVPARPSRLNCALATVAAAAAAFLICAPYTLLDLPGFLDSIARVTSTYRGDVAPARPAALLYLTQLRVTLGWPALLLAIAGLTLGLVRIVRGPGRVRWTVVIAFAIVHFWFLSGEPAASPRHLLPLVPGVCVLAAIAVISGVSLLRRYEIPRAPRTALIAALTVAALLPPLLTSIWVVHTLSRDGTADQAIEYLSR